MSLKVPSGHALHVPEADPVPVIKPKYPTSHRHVDAAVDPGGLLDCDGQRSHTAEPADALNLPGTQGTQTSSPGVIAISFPVSSRIYNGSFSSETSVLVYPGLHEQSFPDVLRKGESLKAGQEVHLSGPMKPLNVPALHPVQTPSGMSTP